MAAPILVGRLPGGSTWAVASRRAPGGNARDDGVVQRVASALGRQTWPVVKPHQAHSHTVVSAGQLADGHSTDADAVICQRAHHVVGMVQAADCAVIAIGGTKGAVAAVHAGWRGLCAGVVENAAAALRALGEDRLCAVVGPTIEACCYEFSDDDLGRVAAYCGDGVRAVTREGRPALDMRAAANAALAGAGVRTTRHLGGCTGCDRDWFSWRARGEAGRHLLLVAAGP